jgi:c-di-GMP-binding flagellar brake protein YcgR
MGYTGPERREFIRVALAIPISYSVAGNQEEYQKSETEDISTGGMRILLRGEFPVGTLLKLKFELLREQKVIQFEDLEARIVWVKPDNNLEYPYKAGIQFVNIDLQESIRISNCIYYKAELLKKPFR